MGAGSQTGQISAAYTTFCCGQDAYPARRAFNILSRFCIASVHACPRDGPCQCNLYGEVIILTNGKFFVGGDMKSADKYLLDLVQYSRGNVKVQAQELSEQLKMRMEMGVTEIPDELIQKAEIIVHQVSVGFRYKG